MSLGERVSSHYDKQTQKSVGEDRKNSVIISLRNLNNLIKHVMIKNSVDQLKKTFVGSRINALDLCCGKGGDLQKFISAGIGYIYGVDISRESIGEYQNRMKESYADLEADFLVTDVTRHDIFENYGSSMKFHLTSCMFALHYGFESVEQAFNILHNACSNLAPGGLFIGILPNPLEIIKYAEFKEALKKRDLTGFDTVNNEDEDPPSSSDSNSDLKFEYLKKEHKINKLFDIQLDDSLKDRSKILLFKAKYHFKLEDAVDCPEFLVYFPLLERMLSSFNMQCYLRTSLVDYFYHIFYKEQALIKRRKLFKKFDYHSLTHMPEDIGSNYDHLFDSYLLNHLSKSKKASVYSISMDEWKIGSLYTIFGFVKVDYRITRVWPRLIPATQVRRIALKPVRKYRQKHHQDNQNIE